MSYKWCVVPQCSSTSIKTPEKLFIQVPIKPGTRKKWLQLARRDPKSIAATSTVFMCEDHFDMEKDVANYMKLKMGFSKKLILVNGAMPLKFYCQADRRSRLSDGCTSRAAFLKRQRLEIIKECEEAHEKENITETCVQNNDIEIQKAIELEPEVLPKTQGKQTTTNFIETAEKSVQTAKKVVHYLSTTPP